MRSVSIRFWILLAFLVLAFLTGGGSRSDIQSLVVLRPVAALACGYGLFTLTRETARQYRFLLGGMLVLILLIGLTLVPLPPSLWRHLPGHAIAAEVDRAAGLGDVWRPITMVPYATWNALYSLLVPAAVLLLGIQLSRSERGYLLPILLGFGALSIIIGILQLVGPVDGPFYFYTVTNNGFPVGLFSNRNHAGLLLACLFPLLAMFATGGDSSTQARYRGWAALIFGIVALPMILVTGSRAGLILGLAGIAAVPLFLRKRSSRDARQRRLRFALWGGAALAVVLVVATFSLSSRAPALARLLGADHAGDLRFQLFGPVFDLAWKYFPAGSGAGTFIEVFQLDEPEHLLALSYANHAHNDWLELWMTGGVAGVVILLAMLAAWVRQSYIVWRIADPRSRDTAYGRAGSIILLMMGVASLADYPLRVPSMMCVAMIAAIWLQSAAIALPKLSGGRKAVEVPMTSRYQERTAEGNS